MFSKADIDGLQSSDTLIGGYKVLICKHFDKSKSEKNEGKIKCGAYYTFRISHNSLRLVGKEEVHSHEAMDFKHITPIMMEDLKLMNKKMKISHIVNYLKIKHSCSGLSYQEIYYQFRKFHHFSGKKTAIILWNTEFYVRSIVDEQDETLCKLLFLSKVMSKNILNFGDILLIDATYNVDINIYKILLLVFSGISAEGKNVLLGMALINNETYITYQWALQNFLEIAPCFP